MGLIKKEGFTINLQEWLSNNYILMYSTNNEGKTVIAEKNVKG